MGAFMRSEAPEVNPIAHVMTTSGVFDANFYRRAYPDVEASGLSPIEHFVAVGLESGRWPSLWFDPAEYSARYADVGGPAKAALHFACHGLREKRKVNCAPFDPANLDEVVRAVTDSGLFDSEFYRQANPVLDDLGMDPLVHYLATGHRTQAEPSPKVSMKAYLGLYPDVRESGANPLVHWLKYGRVENRLLPDQDVESFRWTVPGRSFPLPDDIVHYERMKGEAYFAGQGFDFNDRGTPATIERSVATLARRAPTLSIEPSSPKVSIVIPVYGQMPFVLNCLDSLAQHVSRHSVEIIVADDASPDPMRTALLAQIPWIRYERRAVNGGFVDCCNSAVDLSRGEFVVLLNSDTRVVPRWLDELIDGFELFPKAGMTGSKLFNFDGTLQEAGGIFWRDGSAHNFGRGDDPNRPQYCHARQADYVSGAAIALRRSVWLEMGGFDELFRPAYCEDADLAFRLRRGGYEVWFLPYSRVIHYEGVTHGRDTSQGVKAYQVENLRKFAKRFATELLSHPVPGVQPARAATWRHKQNILFVDALTPRPDLDSGSIVTDEVMRTYRTLGFGESFYPEHDPRYLGASTERLQRMGVCCHYVPYAMDPRGLIENFFYFDYALLYRHNVAATVCEPLRELSPATRVVFANVDLHYLRESRAASTNAEPSGIFKASVTKSRELAMFARANASFVHTEIEKKIIQEEMPRPLKNMVVLPWLTDIEKDSRGLQGREDVMFLGSFPHEPNVDSIKFFMKSIWPLLETQLPVHAKLLVVGNQPPPEVLALASDRVIVTGYVEDLRPYFERSRVFVAPLRYGAGIKGKLVTALAHGVPSVATTIAAEGIGSEQSDHLRVTDDPATFAQEVMRVYSDESLWTQMRTAGWSFVHANYSREAAARLCLQALRLADDDWLERQEQSCKRTLEQLLGVAGPAESETPA